MNEAMITPKGYKIRGWNGVEVSRDTVMRWVDECIERLVQNPSNEYEYTSSGDSVVFVTRDTGMECFDVWVCKLINHEHVPEAIAKHPEIRTQDAPAWYNLAEAEAYVNGYNTARERFLKSNG